MKRDQIALQNLRFEEKTDYEKGFSAYFEDKIKPALLPLENLRLQKVKQTKKTKSNMIKLTILIVIGEIILAPLGLFRLLPILIFAAPITMMVSLFIVAAPGIEYQENVITTMTPLVLAFLGNLNYDRKGRIPSGSLIPSDLFTDVNDYRTQDYIVGKYQGVDLEFESATMTQGQGKGQIIVFSGKIILFKLDKEFSGKTILLPSWSSHQCHDLEPVKLEDPEFEKNYKVFSTDQVEARYLLTPAFMERLDQLAKIYNTDITQASFYDSRILIAFSSKSEPAMLNLFQTGTLYESVINTDDIHNFLTEMHSILETINILQLSDQTGK